MVDAGVLWTMPDQGFIKINVHGFFSDEPLVNGNRTGIGYVFRDDRGRIIGMVGGSLGLQDERINEFYARIMALRRAFLENDNNLILEKDTLEAYWEWKLAGMNGVVPEHRYLAEQGAHMWTQLMVIENRFGRIQELWNNDMGLGPVGEQFREVWEGDLIVEEEAAEEVILHENVQ
ncbi:hypothetical protein POM88_033279 [Heracleum sosnowskyi]|uniref:RNase H type-1 domain-containing protein n=1 Tax=Heracleum sosnowskyi TaxID=360622 RepID=A0AAD8MKV5_9APIA|nr:hypothetical protein POM88_033279 [Heracleum sosnowskyi]